MTLEEAKQLKPGDCILVKAHVAVTYNGRCAWGEGDNILIDLLINDENGTCSYGRHFVSYKEIIEKLIRSRRKFREGDIVQNNSSGSVFEVGCDEQDDGIVHIRHMLKPRHSSNLTLVCAAENREDRKVEV